MRSSSSRRSSASSGSIRVCVGSPGDLLDAEVAVGEARDLRQVRDRDDLRAAGEPAQRLADGVRGLAADAGVDLVEDHRLAAADGRDRERDPRQLAARGGLGDRPERQAGVRAHEERDLVGARRRPARRRAARRGTRPRRGRRRRARAATASANAGAAACAPRAARRGGGRPRPGRARASRPRPAPGSWPSSSAASSRRASSARVEQLVVARGAVAALRVGDPLELGLDRLDAVGLGLERGEEAAQVGGRLAQLQLGRAQRLARRRELGREPFERRDGALGGRDQVGGAVVLVGRERARPPRPRRPRARSTWRSRSRSARSSSSRPGVEAVGVGGERAQLVEPRLRPPPSRASARRGGAAREASSRQARRASRAVSAVPANESSTASW